MGLKSKGHGKEQAGGRKESEVLTVKLRTTEGPSSPFLLPTVFHCRTSMYQVHVHRSMRVVTMPAHSQFNISFFDKCLLLFQKLSVVTYNATNHLVMLSSSLKLELIVSLKKYKLSQTKADRKTHSD